MFPSLMAAQFLLAMRWGWFQEGRFLGKVLDEWIADSQEFIHSRLPHLLVIALIALSQQVATARYVADVARSRAAWRRPRPLGRSKNSLRCDSCHRPGDYRINRRHAVP